MQGALLITNDNSNKISDYTFWKPKIQEDLDSIKQHQSSISESMTERVNMMDKNLQKIMNNNFEVRFQEIQETINKIEEELKNTEEIEKLNKKIDSIDNDMKTNVAQLVEINFKMYMKDNMMKKSSRSRMNIGNKKTSSLMNTSCKPHQESEISSIDSININNPSITNTQNFEKNQAEEFRK